jgi:hypothetical protein
MQEGHSSAAPSLRAYPGPARRAGGAATPAIDHDRSIDPVRTKLESCRFVGMTDEGTVASQSAPRRSRALSRVRAALSHRPLTVSISGRDDGFFVDITFRTIAHNRTCA